MQGFNLDTIKKEDIGRGKDKSTYNKYFEMTLREKAVFALYNMKMAELEVDNKENK